MNRVRSLVRRANLTRRTGGTPRRSALVGALLIGVALVSSFWWMSTFAANTFSARPNTAALPTPPATDPNAPDADQRGTPPDANGAREAAPQAPAIEGRGPKDRPAPAGPERDGPPAPRPEHPQDAPAAPRPLSDAPGAWWGAAPFAMLGSALALVNTAATMMFGVLCLGVGATMLRPRGASEPPRD